MCHVDSLSTWVALPVGGACLPLLGLLVMRQVFEDVVDTLRLRIADGSWPVGSAIPGQVGLSAELGVSRTTVTKAVQVLAEEGVLQARQGVPTVVLRAPGMTGPVTLEDVAERLSAVEAQLAALTEAIQRLA